MFFYWIKTYGLAVMIFQNLKSVVPCSSSSWSFHWKCSCSFGCTCLCTCLGSSRLLLSKHSSFPEYWALYDTGSFLAGPVFCVFSVPVGAECIDCSLTEILQFELSEKHIQEGIRKKLEDTETFSKQMKTTKIPNTTKSTKWQELMQTGQ